jgi:biofilm PGA synthesis N-glycosyltransferase PgaC
MRLLFWICCALTSYAYIGYAVVLSVFARFHKRPVAKRKCTPTISIIIAARNEAMTLPVKLENIYNLDYPQELLEIIVASDGSTDRTAEILMAAGPRVKPVLLGDSNGKAYALNQAVRQATGEILLFLDTRQTVDAAAVSELASCFADPEVGAVSGELLLESADGGSSKNALGLYWKIEKAVRKLESASGSVVGVTGAIYAIRRELYTEIPKGTILDDVFVPMTVAHLGKRVIFEPAAIARDRIFSEKGKEFSRKVRTLTGNYQLLRLAPWLISPSNPLLFRFISHKLLRLAVPLFLVLIVISTAVIPEPFYRLMFWLQVAFYGLAVAGALSSPSLRFKPVAIANTFVMLNAAAALAFYSFVTGRKKLWL